MDAEAIASAYVAIRDARSALLKKYEEEDAKLKKDIEDLNTVLMDLCSTTGADSIKTPSGTIIRSLKERYICSDWDNFKGFVVENGLVDLLAKTINQSNFKEYMGEHSGDGLPPGVNVMREYAITVRRPTKS